LRVTKWTRCVRIDEEHPGEGRKEVVPEGEAEAEGAVERVRRDVPRRSEADGDVARPGRDTRKAAVRGSCEVVVAALLIF
jgi:hypothetical protein